MAQERSPKPYVILCEAYDSLREGLELILGDRYRVSSVSRLADLQPALEEAPPSLLIVDIDGQSKAYEALASIRKAFSALPILLLAREFSLDQQTEALRLLTEVSFMTKPFANDRLLDKVQTLVQGCSDSPIHRHVIRIDH